MSINPAAPPPIDPAARLWARIADLEQRLRAIESYFSGGASMQVPVVADLPPAGRAGRLMVKSTNGKLYVDDGANWNAQT